MGRRQKLERTELWQALEDASASSSLIYLTILPEDIATPDQNQRELIALSLEGKLLSSPALEFYSRVGMYDFLGVSLITVDELMRWFGTCTDARCGLAAVGSGGLAVAEMLMVGTAEASRQDRMKFAFRLIDDRVVPAT
jgi:hypothetical protein